MSDENADLEILRKELESVRAEGLLRMDAWDSEKRESKRLRAMMERFRAQADELRGSLTRLQEQHEQALEQIQNLTSTVTAQEQAVSVLAEAMSRYGQHDGKCKFNPRKKDSSCTCGLTEALESLIPGN
jgi:chromosome segregation ATPase